MARKTVLIVRSKIGRTIESHMTWTEAFRKGRSRWLKWIAIFSILGRCFFWKGGTQSELLWAMLIGAAIGAAVGFALGPAVEKGAIILSGLLVGTPFYLIGVSLLGSVSSAPRKSHRHMEPVELVAASIFLAVGVAFSFGQAFRVRRHIASAGTHNDSGVN